MINFSFSMFLCRNIHNISIARQFTCSSKILAESFGISNRAKKVDLKPRVTNLLERVLHIRRVARVNSGGKIRTVSALAIVGDERGSAGYGMGRGTDASTAVAKAVLQAKKNIQYFERLDNRTIHSNIDFKYHRVQFKFRNAKPGNCN
jgi:small subunit ribosomal protein S5